MIQSSILPWRQRGMKGRVRCRIGITEPTKLGAVQGQPFLSMAFICVLDLHIHRLSGLCIEWNGIYCNPLQIWNNA